MQFSFTALSMLIIAGLVLWFWRNALRQRDRASNAAMDTCAQLSLQFLDGTAAFSHWRLGREAGGWRLRRTYTFDYTAHSIERKQGFVVMLAGRVETVGFAPTENPIPRMPGSSVNVTVTFGPQKTDGSNAEDAGVKSESARAETTVFDLSAWRREHPPRSRLH